MNAKSQIKTTENCFWLKQGRSCLIKTIQFINSTNIISAIASSGFSL